MDPLSWGEIIVRILFQFTPVWIALILTFVISIKFKSSLGLYGRLFDSMVGMVGFALVMFWAYTAFFTGVFDLIATHDPISQASGMKNKVPGTPLKNAAEGAYEYYLLGGDNLARDVFSRVVKGSTIVIAIAPFATLFAYMVGFPLVFLGMLLNSKYETRPSIRTPILLGVLGGGFVIYMSAISDTGRSTAVDIWPSFLDLFDVNPEVLIVFVSVVFVNSPTIFRIVRGLTLDVKSRDYVAAAQTRGESPWYIMLWEILPNVRGPLIVDFCLRIGYTTILLGTLGFFGLGLPPESPDWGTTINDGRRLLSVYLHPPLVPAISLLSLVLGLNLLADGLREESLKD